MKKIRIGNDITVTWTILRNGEAYTALASQALTLLLSDGYNRTVLTDFSVSGNVVTWTFGGKDQKRCAAYTLTLIVNDGASDMHTLDTPAFQLVPLSAMTGGNDAENLTSESVSLTGNIEAVGSGERGGNSASSVQLLFSNNYEADSYDGLVARCTKGELLDTDEVRLLRRVKTATCYRVYDEESDLTGYYRKRHTGWVMPDASSQFRFSITKVTNTASSYDIFRITPTEENTWEAFARTYLVSVYKDIYGDLRTKIHHGRKAFTRKASEFHRELPYAFQFFRDGKPITGILPVTAVFRVVRTNTTIDTLEVSFIPGK